MASSNSKENILFIGATGYIGTYILAQIIAAKSSFGRIAIFTSQATVEKKAEDIAKLKEQGVEVIVGDLTKSDDLLPALEGITTVISAVGRPIIASQVAWIPLFSQHPTVKRFFPSEYGTDIEYGPQSVNEVPHQQKLKVRAALKEVKAEDLEYTYVVTGPYASAYIGGGGSERDKLGTFDVKGKRAVLVGDGTGKVSVTTVRDVGKLVVKALLHREASRNRALRVNSFTTTPAEIVAEFERQRGEKWDVSYTSIETVRALEKEAYESKNPWAVGFTLKRIWNEGGTLYEKRDNYLIDADEGLETLEDAVRDSIARQLSA